MEQVIYMKHTLINTYTSIYIKWINQKFPKSYILKNNIRQLSSTLPHNLRCACLCACMRKRKTKRGRDRDRNNDPLYRS